MNMTPFQANRYVPPGYNGDTFSSLVIVPWDQNASNRLSFLDPFHAKFQFNPNSVPFPDFWLRQGNDWTQLSETAPGSGQVLIPLSSAYLYNRLHLANEPNNITQFVRMYPLGPAQGGGTAYQASVNNIRTESLPSIASFPSITNDQTVFRGDKIPDHGFNFFGPAGISLIRYEISNGLSTISETETFYTSFDIGGVWRNPNGTVSVVSLNASFIPQVWWRLDYAVSAGARQVFPFSAYPPVWASNHIVYVDTNIIPADNSVISVALQNRIEVNETTGAIAFFKRLLCKRSLDGEQWGDDSAIIEIAALPDDAPLYPITLLIEGGVIVVTDSREDGVAYRSLDFGRTWENLN